MPHIEVELPRCCHGIVTVWLFDKQNISEIACIAEERELVLIAGSTLDVACVPQPKTRMSQQVQSNVGQRDIFFEHRTMPAPLGQALAENEAVVSEAKQ